MTRDVWFAERCWDMVIKGSREEYFREEREKHRRSGGGSNGHMEALTAEELDEVRQVFQSDVVINGTSGSVKGEIEKKTVCLPQNFPWHQSRV